MPFPEPNQVAHQLDRMPKPLAIALGLPLGVGLALAVLSMPLALGAVAFASLLGFAGFIAWSGEPVSVAEPEQPPQPTEAPKTEPTRQPETPPQPTEVPKHELPRQPKTPPQPTEAPNPEPSRLPKRPPKPTEASKPEPPRQPETPHVKTPAVSDPLWVNIPGGSFAMGSDERDNERPVHTVHLSPFQLMRTLVTRKHYQKIMGSDPGWPVGDADERPVNQVSWLDAVKFCNRWSVNDGLKPCYQIDGGKVTWEYACRAGSTTRWCFGDGVAKLPEYAWFNHNSGGKTHPVATRKPNAWGLFDMHGNVWEWCWDRYGSYDKAEQTDPVGLAYGSSRVLRGGSCLFGSANLGSALRDWIRPENRGRFYGFRCARGPRRQ